MASKKKLVLVQQIQDLLSKYQNFALIKIDKTNHQTLESLRKELKKNQAKFKVVKNTLFEKSIDKLTSTQQIFVNIKKSFFPLKETSALLFLEKQWGRGLKTFYQFSKKEASLSFKFGLLDGKTYADSEILQIAQLPEQEELLAHLIRTIKSPASSLVFSLKFNSTKFVHLIKQKSKNIKN